MARIAIIGGNGQLGSDLVAEWQKAGDEVTSLTHDQITVEDVDSVRSVLTAIKPGIILNTAAFHNVPQCEANPARAYAVNGLGALNIARVAEELGARNVYFSTDYVFDGAKGQPYLEADRPNPLNVYAVTKAGGEYFTSNYCRSGYVMRVSGIYGRVPCRAKGGNFVTTMLKAAREKPEVRVVTDEVLTPTPTAEIARVSRTIVEHGEPGIYHATSEGHCSWYEFAKAIFETLGLSTPLRPATVRDFPSPVRRPFYSVLENGMIKKQGLQGFRPWNEALVHFLRIEYGANTTRGGI